MQTECRMEAIINNTSNIQLLFDIGDNCVKKSHRG
jgi:hypothetical protein